MPVFSLDEREVSFPPAHLADESGLLAVGGDLSTERLMEAYRNGIFPWYNPDEPILWWSPDPRFVLYPEKMKISRSMRQILRTKKFQVTFDQDFLGVIAGCREIYRPDQDGTWISEETVESYHQLFLHGFAHCVAVWQDGKLIAGLYGCVVGKCFFGESMFTKVSNASKVGFIMLTKNLLEQGFKIIDCQIHTNHLESLGAEMISRLSFLEIIRKNEASEIDTRSWNEYFKTDFQF